MTKLSNILGRVLDSIIDAIPEDPEEAPTSEAYVRRSCFKEENEELTTRDTPLARAS